MTPSSSQMTMRLMWVSERSLATSATNVRLSTVLSRVRDMASMLLTNFVFIFHLLIHARELLSAAIAASER